MTKNPEKLSEDMIAVTKIQKAKIKMLGRLGDTYADVTERLLDCWAEAHPEDAKMWKQHVKQELKNGKIEVKII